jgi:hypothetical protein
LSGIFFLRDRFVTHALRRALRAWLAASVLAACTPTPSKPPASQVNLGGFPPTFRDGYNDGCRSAQGGSTRRDDKRYAEDRQYAAGWRDGFDICKREKGS